MGLVSVLHDEGRPAGEPHHITEVLQGIRRIYPIRCYWLAHNPREGNPPCSHAIRAESNPILIPQQL